MSDRAAELSNLASALLRQKMGEIETVARHTKMLAINASIEAAHAGQHGAGFGIVAREVVDVADAVTRISRELHDQLEPVLAELAALGGSESSSPEPVYTMM